MLEIRMELDLVDRWRYFARLQDPFEMLWQVIADADRFREALFLELFHLLPFCLMVFLLVAEEW